MDGYADFCAAELAGLTRFAVALSGDRQSAHDLLADSLVQVQLHWDKVSRAQNTLAYVRRIVTNRYISDRRSWSFRHVGLTLNGNLPEGTAPDPAAGLDDRTELESMLRELPRQQRAAPVLRYLLDLPDNQIADHLNCSLATVRSHVSHALATLRIVAAQTARYGS